MHFASSVQNIFSSMIKKMGTHTFFCNSDRDFYSENNNVLFRTRNLGQHFFDISKKNDVNQSLVSLINDNY
jgi:hypothetical protein